MKTLFSLLAGAGVMGVLDGIWLKGPGGALYKNSLKLQLRLEHPVWIAAILVYLLLLVGLFVLVVPRAAGSLGWAAGFGALFGLVVYGVYDFTNLALVVGWTTKVALVDVAWGTFLCASTAVAMTAAGR